MPGLIGQSLGRYHILEACFDCAQYEIMRERDGGGK